MKKWFALIALLALTACETAPPEKPVVPDVPAIQEKTQVVIPTGLTATCPPLTPITQPQLTQGELLDALKVWFNQYDLCAGRFSKFVTVVAPALNIKELDQAVPAAASGTTATNSQNGQ